MGVGLIAGARRRFPVPPFNNVQFLSGFEGTDGATTFANSEGNLTGLAITGHGSAQIDTAQKAFGSSSLLLNGSTDYVSLADNLNWTPSLNGFVIEAWIRFDTGADLATKSHTIMAQYFATGNQRSWIFNYAGPLGALAFSGGSSGSSLTTFLSYSWTPTKGVWYYVAAERSKTAPGTYRLYVGQAGGMALMVAKTTTGLATGFFNSTSIMTIGALANPVGDFFNGWIDEARYVNGITPYDTDLGYPVPVSAFPRS